MSIEHHYKTKVRWTGNNGPGTTDANAYERSHTLSIQNKVDLFCSSDTPFRGDGTKHNPEDALLYALSACHMLWYLHMCADHGVVVLAYEDNAQATMLQVPGGGGHFKEATLFPQVQVAAESMIEMALSLHDLAHKKCFIANSCNFPVLHQASCEALK